MEVHYRAWFDDGLIQRFARKTPAEFFASETHFLERIGPDIRTVLDIGCASGRFLRVLDQYAPGCEYTGLDLVAENIELARREFPWAQFRVGNGVGLSLGSSFDLVNATGVMQAEPHWKELVDRMTAHSDRYVLFDVKLAAMPRDLADINRAFVNRNGHRLYCIVLSVKKFVDFLRSLRGISRAWVYGYETRPNAHTTMPPGAGTIVSAGVLLERGYATGGPALSIDLPGSIWEEA